MKKAALFLVLMLLCALPAPADSLQAAGPVEEADQASLAGYIIILYTGDTLGQADENLGFDRVAEAKERFAKEGAAVLLLDAGNAFPAPAEGEEDQSADIAKAMTKAGYDAMTPGEADFAGSARRLTALAKEAGFPLLSANAKDGDGAQLLSGSILVERDGLRIGVFGLTGNIEAEGLTVSSASKAASGRQSIQIPASRKQTDTTI